MYPDKGRKDKCEEKQGEKMQIQRKSCRFTYIVCPERNCWHNSPMGTDFPHKVTLTALSVIWGGN